MVIKHLSLILLFFLTSFTCLGQVIKKSVYIDLPVVRYGSFDAIKNCKPCILEKYDTNNRLIRRAVQYTDCIVGLYQEYYPNGQMKINGQTKEHASGDWQDVLCMKMVGEWTYYNLNGSILKKEIWKEGEFIKELPEQPLNEIWKVELQLNNKKIIEDEPIDLSDINKIEVVPFFKNKSKAGINIADTLVISAIGKRDIKIGFTNEKIFNLNIKDLMISRGFNLSQKNSYKIRIYNNNIIYTSIWFRVKEE